MRKVRVLGLFLGSFLLIFPILGQNDTMKRHGFVDFREAADTLYAYLLNKKYNGIQKFTVDENTFVKETRKIDTIIPPAMIKAQYTVYWGKVERTYKKVYKKLKKRKIKAIRAQRDTVLLYRNTGNPDVQRAELYFSQKKYYAFVKYQLWKVDGLWYFSGKLELVEEKTK